MIKNIIFDLGNVILNIDTDYSKKAFERYGLNNFDKIYTLASQINIFDRLETGNISVIEFCNEFRDITKTNFSNEIITECWNALILDYPKERIEILKQLKNKFRTFILSNTNAMHYDCYTKLIKEKFDLENLDLLVEYAYYSHLDGMRKPDINYYKYVLSNSKLLAEETLYLDDNKTNIETAQSLGINCIHIGKINMEDINFDNYK